MESLLFSGSDRSPFTLEHILTFVCFDLCFCLFLIGILRETEMEKQRQRKREHEVEVGREKVGVRRENREDLGGVGRGKNVIKAYEKN